MRQLERLLKVLADKNRMRILKLLEKKKMCVCELAFVLGITQPSTSRHLKKLKSAGLIQDEQEGLWTNYFLTTTENGCCKTLLKNIGDWLNQEPIIKEDLRIAKKINRVELCCKVTGRSRK